MKVIVFLAACVAMAAAGVTVGSAPADYLKIVRGPRSDVNDDDRAFATCPEDYTLLKCECETFASDPDGCDGVAMINDAKGDKCSAANSARGKGVVAKATCAKVLIIVSTPYEDSPILKCPAKYRLVSCSKLTPVGHQYAELNRPPVVKQDGGTCKTTKGCDQCKLYARCIRQTGFFDDNGN